MSELADLNKRESTDSIMRRLKLKVRPSKHKVSVADALEFRREAYGLDRVQFCELLGIWPSHYSEVINGKKRLPIKAVQKAFALGVPPKVLLQITED